MILIYVTIFTKDHFILIKKFRFPFMNFEDSQHINTAKKNKMSLSIIILTFNEEKQIKNNL